MYLGMKEVQDVSWMREANLDSNCEPSLEKRQYPSRDNHFPSYGRRSLKQDYVTFVFHQSDLNNCTGLQNPLKLISV